MAQRVAGIAVVQWHSDHSFSPWEWLLKLRAKRAQNGDTMTAIHPLRISLTLGEYPGSSLNQLLLYQIKSSIENALQKAVQMKSLSAINATLLDRSVNFGGKLTRN